MIRAPKEPVQAQAPKVPELEPELAPERKGPARVPKVLALVRKEPGLVRELVPGLAQPLPELETNIGK